MTNITTLRPGEHFIFKNSEWVCLDPHHPDGGVLAIMAEPWAKDVKFCPDEQYVDEKGNWNNYRTSNVRGILSDIYTIKCLALIFVAAPGAMLIGALLIYLFALCCKQISGLWREQK